MASKKKKITILPITQDHLTNPSQFSFWLFSMTPQIMDGLFERLDDAPPKDQIMVLQNLLNTCLNARPMVVKTDQSSTDTAKTLLDVLSATAEEMKKRGVDDPDSWAYIEDKEKKDD